MKSLVSTMTPIEWAILLIAVVVVLAVVAALVSGAGDTLLELGLELID